MGATQHPYRQPAEVEAEPEPVPDKSKPAAEDDEESLVLVGLPKSQQEALDRPRPKEIGILLVVLLYMAVGVVFSLVGHRDHGRSGDAPVAVPGESSK